MTDHMKNISVMFDDDLEDEQWNKICKDIYKMLEKKGYRPVEVFIY